MREPGELRPQAGQGPSPDLSRVMSMTSAVANQSVHGRTDGCLLTLALTRRPGQRCATFSTQRNLVRTVHEVVEGATLMRTCLSLRCSRSFPFLFLFRPFASHDADSQHAYCTAQSLPRPAAALL
ncbi:hypothetical protein MPTK1_4g16440 [Marchantia polymorpha subsp. ruderalis]|uniref:Uncharacterized protein n=2 Tax=Marchantia polymorpha TaxID=3197 RepID=A0AAF6BAI5_MARPO|nr:hypothetical protein MARPO_0054s0109 [Marchantia polymorpha]BBN09019.1 hypothetical protein Mp_4g16440 [Marchantia polymorpha subsp. ruderalis]|eukprot:PTQ38008.1 hypothetical protein MARPO_0054s0109 [Marchantia polymorpha]